MPAGLYDLLIEQGATFVKDIVWKDGYGVAVDVVGYTARMQIRPHTSSDTVMLSATTENGYIVIGPEAGTIHISIPATVTAALTQSRGVYDLEMVDPDGVVTRLLQGGVAISKEVTR